MTLNHHVITWTKTKRNVNILYDLHAYIKVYTSRTAMARQAFLTNLADALAVGQVVCDDLAQLWEVPAVPLPAAHDVVIQLLIQVV